MQKAEIMNYIIGLIVGIPLFVHGLLLCAGKCASLLAAVAGSRESLQQISMRRGKASCGCHGILYFLGGKAPYAESMNVLLSDIRHGVEQRKRNGESRKNIHTSLFNDFRYGSSFDRSARTLFCQKYSPINITLV